MQDFQKDVENLQFAIEKAPMVWADQVNVRNSLELIQRALYYLKVDKNWILQQPWPPVSEEPKEEANG